MPSPTTPKISTHEKQGGTMDEFMRLNTVGDAASVLVVIILLPTYKNNKCTINTDNKGRVRQAKPRHSLTGA